MTEVNSQNLRLLSRSGRRLALFGDVKVSPNDVIINVLTCGSARGIYVGDLIRQNFAVCSEELVHCDISRLDRFFCFFGHFHEELLSYPLHRGG